MLQDEILKVGEYFRAIEQYGNALIVKVDFPPKWSVYPSEDGSVKHTVGEDGLHYYYADSEKGVTLEEIFKLIVNTIEMNKDIEAKVKLLKEKVEELKEFFSITPLEELKRLKFVIEKQKKTVKKKAKTKAMEEPPKVEDEKIKETETVDTIENDDSN